MTKTLNAINTNHTFSEKSLQLLNTINKQLGILATEVLKISKIKFEITEGYRDQTTQQKYFKEGKSQLDGIIKKSKHQQGKAIDIVCYDPNTNKPTYDKKELYYYIAGLFECKAKELTIEITWGGWWSFEDCVHFELND